MRVKNMILWDICFQKKYGFYLLYVILTMLYLLLLSAFPAEWRAKTGVILIFSDPAAMGLFFMGAIVLFEKSQRVHCALAVAPVKVGEYVAAKVASLGLVSLLVGGVLAYASGLEGLLSALLGTALGSIIFSLLGIIVATKITSLNQFLIATVPIELICFIPGFLYLFDNTPGMLRYAPVNVCVAMIAGMEVSFLGIAEVFIFIGILSYIACRCVSKMWNRAGGARE